MSKSVRLVRLSKKDVEALSDAYGIDTEREGIQKNDIVVVDVKKTGSSFKCSLKSEDGEVKVFRPTSRDTIAYTFTQNDKVYKLGELGREAWNKFAESVQMREARKELGVDKEDGIDKKNRFLPFLRNVTFEKDDKNFEISILLGSVASLAEYVPYAKKVEKIADKLDKQTEKLTKLMKDMNDIKNLENEFIEKNEDEPEEDFDFDYDKD